MSRTNYTRCDRPKCRTKVEGSLHETRPKYWRRLTIEYPREGREQTWEVCSLECMRSLLQKMVHGEVETP